MAFNKTSMALILLFAAAAIVDARLDLLTASESSRSSEPKASWSDCCNNCIDDGGAFYCIDLKDGQCPESCNDCFCPSTSPLRCGCLDAIDACPSKCAAGSKFSSLLDMKMKNQA